MSAATAHTPAQLKMPTQPKPPGRKSRKRRRPVGWVILGVAILIGLFIAFPLILIVINSFKSPQDYATGGPLSLPNEFYTDGLTAFWERVNFPEKVWNSIFISGTVAVLGVLLSMLKDRKST